MPALDSNEELAGLRWRITEKFARHGVVVKTALIDEIAESAIADKQAAIREARAKELQDFVATLKSSHLCGGGSETSDTVRLIVFMLERKIKHLRSAILNQPTKEETHG